MKGQLKVTKYTMEQDFYKNMLIQKGIEVVTPNEVDRNIINDVIYNELCLGIITDKSKKEYLKIIDKLIAEGVEGVILGCTEIGMLVHQEDTNIPLFDTTEIHAKRVALLSI